MNFVTSCGGFLSTILFGWLGMRVNATTLYFSNPFLPSGTDSITLPHVAYGGGVLRVRFEQGGSLNVSVVQESHVCHLRVGNHTVHCTKS
jgi:hypothetical protein